MNDVDADEVLKRIDEVSNQLTLVLETLNTFAAQRVADYQRLNSHDERLVALERRVQSDPPPGLPPAYRAPQPSLTSEERRDMHTTTTKSIQVVAKATKLTPWITAGAIVLSAFVTGIVQSCQMTASTRSQPTHQGEVK